MVTIRWSSSLLRYCTRTLFCKISFSNKLYLIPTNNVQINERLEDIINAPDEDSKQAKLAFTMFEIAKVCLVA